MGKYLTTMTTITNIATATERAARAFITKVAARRDYALEMTDLAYDTLMETSIRSIGQP